MDRRLAAILVADVVGYSRLMEADEPGTVAAMKERRKAILEPIVRAHGGRIVKLMGDGVLVEFASAVKAVEAALELQGKMAEANESIPEERRILLRIGINLGDIIGEGIDIYGDGVNIAARLEQIAEPGGIVVSDKIRSEVRGKIAPQLEDLGEKSLKNLAEPVRVFRLRPGQDHRQEPETTPATLSVVVLPSELERGPRPAISLGRCHRRHHYAAVALPASLGVGAPRGLSLSRQGSESRPLGAGARCQLRGRGQRS
jgi:class 3 adenylate cyclase